MVPTDFLFADPVGSFALPKLKRVIGAGTSSPSRCFYVFGKLRSGIESEISGEFSQSISPLENRCWDTSLQLPHHEGGHETRFGKNICELGTKFTSDGLVARNLHLSASSRLRARVQTRNSQRIHPNRYGCPPTSDPARYLGSRSTPATRITTSTV